MKAVIGLDIGTTSTEGLLLQPGGEVLAVASRATRLFSPHPGWAEEDPEEWWTNTCAVIRDLIQTSGLHPADVAAVAVAGMLPALVLSDADGRILRRSIQQSDGRCGREVEELVSELDEGAFLKRTGKRHQPATPVGQAAVAGPPRAGGASPDRPYLRVLRSRQLPADRRAPRLNGTGRSKPVS